MHLDSALAHNTTSNTDGNDKSILTSGFGKTLERIEGPKVDGALTAYHPPGMNYYIRPGGSISYIKPEDEDLENNVVDRVGDPLDAYYDPKNCFNAGHAMRMKKEGKT